MIKGQKNLHEEIEKKKFEKNGEAILPVYDGVVNIDVYCNQPFKVMWILKEPYENGQETSAGWMQFEKIDSGTVSKLPSLRKITYISALLLKYPERNYDSLPQNIEEYSNVLQSIAFINTGKFLAKKRTSSSRLQQCYENWEEILHRQIKLYDADVLFFGGTFDVYKSYFEKFGCRIKEMDIKYTIKCNLYEVEFNSKKHLLIDTWHPGYFRCKEQNYVDVLATIAREQQIKNNIF